MTTGVFISGSSYSVLFSFGTNAGGYLGASPVAPLVTQNGLLYGTTEYGGAFGVNKSNQQGTVFSITPTGAETVLYSFKGTPDGTGPAAGLTIVNGKLYGTTAAGGTYGGGTVFSMDVDGRHERVLHSFGNGSDGVNPRADLLWDAGTLYGTTFQGGASGDGTIFSVRVKDRRERVLHSFTNEPDGAYPVAGLVELKNRLCGVTQLGGSGHGTVFSVTKSGDEGVLYGFGGADGAFPEADLTAIDGVLYGTTAGGGAHGLGTAFLVHRDGTHERVLHSFAGGADGIGPVAPLLLVASTLYGTTTTGGTANLGTVFRMRKDGTEERIVHAFLGASSLDGAEPDAGLATLQGSLFGTTYSGGVSAPSCSYRGACDWGTVFALAP